MAGSHWLFRTLILEELWLGCQVAEWSGPPAEYSKQPCCYQLKLPSPLEFRLRVHPGCRGRSRATDQPQKKNRLVLAARCELIRAQASAVHRSFLANTVLARKQRSAQLYKPEH